MPQSNLHVNRAHDTAHGHSIPNSGGKPRIVIVSPTAVVDVWENRSFCAISIEYPRVCRGDMSSAVKCSHKIFEEVCLPTQLVMAGSGLEDAPMQCVT